MICMSCMILFLFSLILSVNEYISLLTKQNSGSSSKAMLTIILHYFNASTVVARKTGLFIRKNVIKCIQILNSFQCLSKFKVRCLLCGRFVVFLAHSLFPFSLVLHERKNKTNVSILYWCQAVQKESSCKIFSMEWTVDKKHPFQFVYLSVFSAASVFRAVITWRFLASIS